MRVGIVLSLTRNGNRINVVGGPCDVFYEIEGIDLAPIENWGFCVWHMLVWAMRRGTNIHVAGPVDQGTIDSAERFARTWELWNPRRFRFVRVTAEAVAPTPNPDRRADLVMFSGGLDSTDMLLRIGRRQHPGLALTIHGFDHALRATGSFEAALAKSEPLLADLNYNRAVLRTNAAAVAQDYHSWGLRLMGSAALLSSLFKEGAFAANSTIEQDMALHPWGLNHVTDRFFRSDDFALTPLYDISRSEKAANVAVNPVALKGLAFCNNLRNKSRWESGLNCGVCQKCIRAKATFAAETGEIPNIFVDMNLDVSALAVSNRVEISYFVDLYQRARELGTLASVPGLERRFFAAFGAKPEAEPLRTVIRDRLPRPIVSTIRAALSRRIVEIE
jgi:7-cyano-7-deazaguanine synthase in queuosine biosynthesis